jgi:hypothetical protein
MSVPLIGLEVLNRAPQKHLPLDEYFEFRAFQRLASRVESFLLHQFLTRLTRFCWHGGCLNSLHEFDAWEIDEVSGSPGTVGSPGNYVIYKSA